MVTAVKVPWQYIYSHFARRMFFGHKAIRPFSKRICGCKWGFSIIFLKCLYMYRCIFTHFLILYFLLYILFLKDNVCGNFVLLVFY